jgi:RNA polymerase sigma-70 factor (ECF subfamily)
MTPFVFEAPGGAAAECQTSGERGTESDFACSNSAQEARLSAMLRDHFFTVWRTVRRLGLSPSRADEAAQDVFITAARKLAFIAPGAERGYLVGVAIRTASNYRRAAAHRREETSGEMASEVVDPNLQADELLEQKRRRAMLDEALDQLPLPLRTVFVLYELEGMSGREIAELLEVPAGTAASRLRKARDLFQSALRRIKARRAHSGGQP